MMLMEAHPVKPLNPRQSVRSQPRCSGFTLSELLIATAITSVVLAVAFSGLLTLIQADDRAKDQVDRRSELNRALNFIASDMREATAVSYAAPPGWTDLASAQYSPVFYLLKPPQPDGSGPPVTPAIAYYVRSARGVWQGPRVVYRLQPTHNADNDLRNRIFQDVGTKGDALVDAIVIPTAPICSALAGALSAPAGRPEMGLKVFISGAQTAKVCLAGRVEKTRNLSLETQVFTRGRS
jgi:prepilin-type N-terminal cleavage/methylation domain-containing protein